MMAEGLRGPRAPDTRDIAQFMFFDVVSQWEAFCTSVFELQLKKLYGVKPDVATRMMTNVDGHGLIMGYGNPKQIKDRAKALLGKSSPWVNLQQDLGPRVYQYLVCEMAPLRGIFSVIFVYACVRNKRATQVSAAFTERINITVDYVAAQELKSSRTNHQQVKH